MAVLSDMYDVIVSTVHIDVDIDQLGAVKKRGRRDLNVI